jgi:hypothetical protein
VTHTAAHLERSRNGELAGEVGGVAVLAGDAGQVRGVVGDVVEPCFCQRPPQPRRGRFGGGELVGAVLFGVSVVLAEKPTDMADLC